MRTIPPLGPVSRKLDQSGLKWLDFTRAIPFENTNIVEWKGWATFLRAIMIWSGSIWLAYQMYEITDWSWYFYIVSVCISTIVFFCYASLFTLGHDCGHYSFSKNKLANRIVGHFIFSFVHIGFHNWKILHNFHHVYSQWMGKDTTWTQDRLTVEQYSCSEDKKKKEYKIGYSTVVGVLVGYYVTCIRFLFFTHFYDQRISLTKIERRQVLFSSFLVAVTSVIHFLVFYFLGGIRFYFNFHLLPLMIGGVTAVGIPLLQHAHENAVYFDQKTWSPLRGQILGTYNFRMPYFFERLFNDVNLHIVHHINPKVPWYNLRKAHEDLKRKFPEYVFEYDLSWAAIKGIYNNPLSKLNSEFNLYQSVPIAAELQEETKKVSEIS